MNLHLIKSFIIFLLNTFLYKYMFSYDKQIDDQIVLYETGVKFSVRIFANSNPFMFINKGKNLIACFFCYLFPVLIVVLILWKIVMHLLKWLILEPQIRKILFEEHSLLDLCRTLMIQMVQMRKQIWEVRIWEY